MQHRAITAMGLDMSSSTLGRLTAALAVMTVVGALLSGSVALAAEGQSAVLQPASPPMTQPSAIRPPGSQPAPIIHVDNIEHDLGDVWLGAPVEFAFTIYNNGSATLKIINVAPSCGCTVAGGYPREIEPGKSGKFPFTLKTDTFRGNTSKNITIVSNDPVTPSLQLRVRGNFRHRVDVWPAVAFFGTIIHDRQESRTVKIKNNTDKPLELKMDRVQSDRFKFELVETTPAQEFELRIATILPYKPGEIMAAAVLNTNVAEQKVIRVAATGRIPDRLDLYPTSMVYSRPQNTAPERDYASMYFWLNNYGASLVQVNQATVNDPGLTTLVEERAPGKNYRIEVRVPINQGIPAEGRTLTVKTDDPEKPVLTAKILPQIAPPVQTAKNTTTQPVRTPPKPAESMLNQPAPTFSLKTIENRSLATDDLKGKITVLNFISTTCPWCRKQMPEVEKIRAVYQEKGVRFVNVVNPIKRGGQVYSNTELIEALKPMNANLEVAPDLGMQAGRAFNAMSYPSLFIIGKDAKIAAVDVGFNKVGQLAGQLDALLAGKPVPSASQPHPAH